MLEIVGCECFELEQLTSEQPHSSQKRASVGHQPVPPEYRRRSTLFSGIIALLEGPYATLFAFFQQFVNF
jgi:hypothetical protein